MHCASCEVLIERKFKEVPGVQRVNVKQHRGEAVLYCTAKPDLGVLNQSVAKDGYSVVAWLDEQSSSPTASGSAKNTRRDYFEIGGIVLVLLGVYLVLRQFDLLPKSLAITESMSYGVVFLIGLVAAMSTCIAVTGGLLLAAAATYNQRNPHLSGMQRLKPHLYFNIGRVVSYTVLGGLVGALGSVFTLSPFANGVLTILASLVMVLLGFQLLRLFPRFGRLQPRMPKFLAHRIHDLTTSQSKWASFLLGAGTFFLPCGFTQALQLYVLSQGNTVTGALTMLVFALGTLPALMSLSVLSSFARGNFQRYFLKAAGVLVLVVGVFSLRNGFSLTGVSASLSTVFDGARSGQAQVSQERVPIVDGKQVAEMKIVDLSYEPSTFTVVKGLPVEWRINSSKATGCATIVSMPAVGLTEYIPTLGVKTLSFTPDKVGAMPFSCAMGMTTPGAQFNVIENPDTEKVEGSASAKPLGPELPPAQTPLPANQVAPKPAKPAAAKEPEVQKITMEVSATNGFWPPVLKVKAGIPVEFTADVQVDPGGCMSTMLIPDFDIAQFLKIGKNVVTFTPTQKGTISVICPMGVPMTSIEVS